MQQPTDSQPHTCSQPRIRIASAQQKVTREQQLLAVIMGMAGNCCLWEGQRAAVALSHCWICSTHSHISASRPPWFSSCLYNCERNWLRMHRHTPQPGRALENLAGLPRIQRAMVAKKLQQWAVAKCVRHQQGLTAFLTFVLIAAAISDKLHGQTCVAVSPWRSHRRSPGGPRASTPGSRHAGRE